MISPTISVIMPCFNHGEFVAEAVASVIAVKCDGVELIVVDDGSTDERTRKELDALDARGIKVIRQENGGPGPARNAGILVSGGKYILPLDADDHLRPGFIEHGIRILDANPKVGVVYGDAECFGVRTGRWTVGSFDRDRLLHWNYIHCSGIYRRSIWEQNNGYDDARIIQGMEDWDFWLGALEHGWQFAYVPEIAFEYRVAKESGVTRIRGFEAQIAEFVAKKHGTLYRDAWLQLSSQSPKFKWVSQYFRKWLKVWFEQRIQKGLMGSRTNPL